MGIFKQLMYNEISQRIAGQREKEDLIASPDKIAKQVSAVTEAVYPYSKKPKGLTKYTTKFQGYDEAARKKGSSVAGFGEELFAEYSRNLAHPDFGRFTPNEILGESARRLMTESREGKESRLAGMYHEKMLADTAVTNLFGLTGEDKTVKKPSGEMFGMIPYDEYTKRVREAPVEEVHTGVLESAGIGAAFATAAYIGKSVLAKRALAAGITAAIPLPGAGIAAAAILAVPEFMAFDWVSNAIAKTDWGRAREGSWKKVGADLLLGGAVLTGGGKAAGKLFKLAKAGIRTGKAFEDLKRLPDAQRLLEYQRAIELQGVETLKTNKNFFNLTKNTKKEIYKLLEAPESKAPSPWGESGWPRVMEENAPGLVVPTKTMGKRNAEAAAKFAKFNDEMTEVALHFAKREGIMKGVEKASILEAKFEGQRITERARARAIAAAKKTEAVDPAFGTAEVVKKEVKEVPVKAKDVDRIRKRYWRLWEEGDIAGARKIGKAEEIAREAELKGKVEAVGGYLEKKPATSLMEADMLTEDEAKELAKHYKDSKTLFDTPFSGSDLDPVEDAMSHIDRSTDVDKLFRSIGIIGVGLTAAIAASLTPDSAEAGVWSPGMKFIKAVGKEAAEKYVSKEAYAKTFKEELTKVGAFSEGIDPLKPHVLPKAMKHISLSKNIADSGEKIISKVTRTKSMPLGLGRFLTPHGIGQLFFKPGFSPDLELGHMMAAFHVNSANSIQVAKNILNEVPQLMKENAYKEIVKTMEPLAKRHGGTVVAAGAIESKLIKTKDLIERFNKARVKKPKLKKFYGKSMESLEKQAAKLEVAKQEIAPKVEQYLAELKPVEQDLAKRYSTSRISYAVEDTVDFAHRPWLKGMLTPEEQVAVTRLKDFHIHYADRLKDAGIDTIEHRPYVQHSKHPAWNQEDAMGVLKALDVSASDTLPYTKFYHRTMFSQQMVPDIADNLQKYVTDTERRLGWTRFWGKGKKNSWYSLSKSNIVRSSSELTDFFQRLKDSSVPHPATTGNKLANTYSALEVMRLLAFAPSVPFKHVFKQIGTHSTLGFKVGASNTLDSAVMASRLWRNSSEVKKMYSKFGVKGGAKKKLLDDVAYSYLHQGQLLNNIADIDIAAAMSTSYLGTFDKMLSKISKPGSVPIRMIEAWDRSLSFNAAMEMARKRGMTAQQATFGIYSTVLKNNFLSGPLNPAWMQHPKIRALMLFQNTAFKIAERRFIAASKTGKAVTLAWKDGRALIKSDGIGEALRQLTDVKRFMHGAQNEFKANLIADALGSQRDYFGNSIVRQCMREMLLAGTVISGGAYIGLDFMPHTFHMPFFTHGRTEPTLATSPVVKATIKTMEDWKDEEAEDRDFIVSAFLKNWLGSTRGIPLVANKALRINDDDIPTIYEEGKFPPWIKYLFSVPGRE